MIRYTHWFCGLIECGDSFSEEGKTKQRQYEKSKYTNGVLRMSSTLSAGVNKPRFRIKHFPEVARHPGKRLLYLVEFVTKSLKTGPLSLTGGIDKTDDGPNAFFFGFLTSAKNAQQWSLHFSGDPTSREKRALPKPTFTALLQSHLRKKRVLFLRVKLSSHLFKALVNSSP